VIEVLSANKRGAVSHLIVDAFVQKAIDLVSDLGFDPDPKPDPKPDTKPEG
jgi:hypothetical protein